MGTDSQDLAEIHHSTLAQLGRDPATRARLLDQIRLELAQLYRRRGVSQRRARLLGARRHLLRSTRTARADWMREQAITTAEATMARLRQARSE